MNKTLASGLLTASDSPPADYDRAPTFDKMIREIDVYVPMRDGVKLCVDVYRPDTTEKLPALLAFAIYNKDFQGPDIAEALPPQPAWTPLWTGPLEAGDTHFLVSRGYIHVIGSPRGVGKSEGGGSRAMGQLRPDRMDRRAAVVRRQCRHGRHFRLRRRAVPCRQAAAAAPEGDLSVRSARRLRHAGQLPRGISRRRAAHVPLSGRAFLGDASAPAARRARCRSRRRAIGGRRWPIPTIGCTRTSTICWRRRGSTCRPIFDLLD